MAPQTSFDYFVETLRDFRGYGAGDHREREVSRLLMAARHGNPVLSYLWPVRDTEWDTLHPSTAVLRCQFASWSKFHKYGDARRTAFNPILLVVGKDGAVHFTKGTPYLKRLALRIKRNIEAIEPQKQKGE